MDKLVDSPLSARPPRTYDGLTPGIDRESNRPASGRLIVEGARAMTERQPAPDVPARSEATSELPPPDVAAFIRYCHRRRGFSWPELYDEMCGVAARREFNGWDHAQLAALGLTFSLIEMPRLSAWARAVLAREDEPITARVPTGARQSMKAALA